MIEQKVCKILDRMKSFQTLTFLEEFGRYWSRRGAVHAKAE